MSEKNYARTLRIGLYGDNKELLSNQIEIRFDIESDNTRDREKNVTLFLGKEADKYNKKEVLLILDEKYSGTSYYKDYKKIPFMIQRSITTDFDF